MSTTQQVTRQKSKDDYTRVYANSRIVEVTNEMLEEAKEQELIHSGSDSARSTHEKNVHRASGYLGEIAFCKLLDKSPTINYSHQGGKTEPDVVVWKLDGSQSVAVDVKTRLAIQHFKSDCIVKDDVVGGLHERYVLCRIIWSDEVTEDDDVYSVSVDDIEAIEFGGWFNVDDVEKHGYEPNFATMHGKPNQNNRKNLLLEKELARQLEYFGCDLGQ